MGNPASSANEGEQHDEESKDCLGHVVAARCGQQGSLLLGVDRNTGGPHLHGE